MSFVSPIMQNTFNSIFYHNAKGGIYFLLLSLLLLSVQSKFGIHWKSYLWFFPFYKRDTTFTYYSSFRCAEIFSIPFHIRDLDLDPYNVFPHPVKAPSILYDILFLCLFAFYLGEKVGGGGHPCPHLCISRAVICGHPV